MVEKGVEQRDAALKSGGDGCTTIILRDGELVLPPDWSIDEHSPELAAQIRSRGMEERDIVLIGGSNTSRREAAVTANSARWSFSGKFTGQSYVLEPIIVCTEEIDTQQGSPHGYARGLSTH